MSWSMSASGRSAEAAGEISRQVKARKAEGSEKVALLAGADAVDRIANEYPDNNMTVSFYGHADQNGVSSFRLEIGSSPILKE